MCRYQSLEHNIDLNKRTDWIKPLDFQKYIVERAPAMIHDVKVEEYIYDIENAYNDLEKN